jgi:hypothetical protein
MTGPSHTTCATHHISMQFFFWCSSLDRAALNKQRKEEQKIWGSFAVPLEHLTWCLPFLITLCPLAK